MSRYARPVVVSFVVGAAILGAFAVTVRVVAQAPAQLSGVVISADGQSQPIRRAVVTLTSAALPINLSVISDDRGAFTFVNLPPGTYSVSASKAAYLKTAFGATRPGEPGTPLTLREGQRLTDLRLTLARGAVLSGAIRDALGAPAAGVHVTIAPAVQLTGASDYTSPDEGPIVTDERGSYRAYGLAPGEYVIAATPRMPGPGSMTRIAIRLSSQTIDGLLRELQSRGSGRAAALATAPTPTSQPGLSYAPFYYPGTPVARDAAKIIVSAGEVREGLDFALDLVPSATIEGRVVTVDGSELPRVQLSITAVGPPLPFFWSLSVGSNQKADGTFSFVNLTPGQYVLSAKGTPGTTSVAEITAGGRGGGGSGPARPNAGLLWAMTDVMVNGADLTGITLSLRPAFSFGGRVVFDSTALAPPADLTKLRVGLLPATPNGSPIIGVPVPPAATVGADGAFEVNSVMPGLYAPISRVPGMPGWRLRSAVVNGKDLLDIPIEFTSASTDVRDAFLTFSDRHTTVSGVLSSVSTQSTAGYSVIVFPVDRTLWSSNRRFLSSRFSTDGRYTFSDVPAGQYWIAVVADLDPDGWKQASFLEQAIAGSTRVAIAEGGAVRQDFKIR